MSLWSRFVNVFRSDRLNREIDEEFEAHIAQAIREGRDPAEARRAFGSALQNRERSRDFQIVPWVESLAADCIFGWRQLLKRKTTSAAAVLSLALAIGSCVAAFRLVDALLWRPLPVDAPERLYVLSREINAPDGKLMTSDSFEYPMFRQMRAQVRDQAELIAVSNAEQVDITYRSDHEMEKAYQQYVSGWMFEALGIGPAAGRVFTEDDDRVPGAHPYAVLSFEYWKRRFAEDPAVVGRTLRIGGVVYQIVGVSRPPFTGTEPGKITDIFLPTMMMKNDAIVRSDYQWFRTFVQLKPGAAAPLVREKLRSPFRVFVEERAKASVANPMRDQRLVMNPASAGVSAIQREYGAALYVLGSLVLLVLLIACANVANLMTAQAAARQREMALRISIGAGRWRLVQLVVAECAELAFIAAFLGACFAWWTAPMVLAMIGAPEDPVRLVIPADWRVLGFSAGMALGVTILFGLAPALRASSVKPVNALKGSDAHSRRRITHPLIAAQVAFCVLVLFVAGLFTATSRRLVQQRTGFSAERLLTLETVTPQPQHPALWKEAADQLRNAPGVAAVAISEWPLMIGGSWNGFISVNGAAPGPVASYFLNVSPEWREVMKIPLLQGSDFRAADHVPGFALVNETFARQYFGTESPVGKAFEVVSNDGHRNRFEVRGLVGDARYRDMREPMRPTAYFPFQVQAGYTRATFLVRSIGENPLTLASALRQDVARAHPGFRVSNIRTQSAIIEQHTVRERLLSGLALFFGAVSLLLAGIGLYGVLDYAVLQRRREISIRMAIGAQPAEIVRQVTSDMLAMVLAGTFAGLLLGIGSVRFVRALLYEVRATESGVLAAPAAAILAVALVASLPAVVRAVRIDPIATLRSE